MHPLTTAFPQASKLIYGCMGLGGGWNNHAVTQADIKQAHAIIECALEHNITVFDHADIYTFTKAEQAFGTVLRENPTLREKMVLQSKCGIRFADEQGPKRYDFSARWITQSVDGILQRLAVDSIEVLLLHRPDPLCDVAELSHVLNQLMQIGKVQRIGVSNMTVAQMTLLNTYLELPIVANQVEFGLHQLNVLEQSITANQNAVSSVNGMSGLLEFAQLQHVQIQAWGCLSQGRYARANTDPIINSTYQLCHQYAQEYQVSIEAIILAFITRIPCDIQPVIGTTNLHRIGECSRFENVILTREQWYHLFETARGEELP